ncbi:50S ribosomal protein L25 [Oribacterium sp. HCP28S3_H8]|uniref:50S ribosomal protein L25 n=1 Tax=Oribacterium sp. HCP28S3_H8 TaxID=3438945 RepID=UPI003F8B50FC
METLQAQKRDLSVKAKKLRREGLMTGSISGRDLKESISLVLSQKDVARLMQDHHVGSQVNVKVDGEDHRTMIKSLNFNGLAHQYIDITFQELVKGEKIKTSAPIVLEHEDQAQGFLTRGIEEVKFETYPRDLVDEIKVDVSKYPVESSITVGDLDIAKNPEFTILTPLTDIVLHVAAHRHVKAEETEAAETADAAAVPATAQASNDKQ